MVLVPAAFLVLGAALPAANDDIKYDDLVVRTSNATTMSYLDNHMVRVGVDLSLGGAITYLAPSRSPRRNVVNSFDWGRQIQMSYYSGPVPYIVPGKRYSEAWKGLGWNPIQVGDCFGNRSRVLAYQNDGKTIHVRCVPMQWPLDDVPGECTFESWITLDGPAVYVRSRLENDRSDPTQYPARGQEMPAVYTNGPYYRLMTYLGDKPFTGAALTRIQHPLGQSGTAWGNWQATEHWAALVDNTSWGLGIWSPVCSNFIGGFAGQPGRGGPKNNPTGYIAPVRAEILDHDIQHEYCSVLILGRLKDIRQYVLDHAPRPMPPNYRFDVDRQGWSYGNATDAGWPIQGELEVKLEADDPQLIGPTDFWKAAAAPTLYIDAAFQTSENEARVFWNTLGVQSFPEANSVAFAIQPDGDFHTYEINLANCPTYRGAITGLRIDPVSQGGPGEWVRVRSISFTKPNP